VKEIARQRSFTWTDPQELAKKLFSIGGLEWLKKMKEGDVPGAPFASALGMLPEAVEEGRVVFSMAAEEWMCNPAGVVHGGMAATLLDTVLTLAVVSLIPHGKSAQTIDMNVHYVRPVLPTGERIVAEGKAVHVGTTIGTAEGRIHNAAGKLIAHGTATLAILDVAAMAARATRSPASP
jgi:uncharacterized protein (TIGR00369 family)